MPEIHLFRLGGVVTEVQGGQDREVLPDGEGGLEAAHHAVIRLDGDPGIRFVVIGNLRAGALALILVRPGPEKGGHGRVVPAAGRIILAVPSVEIIRLPPSIEDIASIEVQPDTPRGEITVVEGLVLAGSEAGEPVALPVPSHIYIRILQAVFVGVHLRRQSDPEGTVLEPGVLQVTVDGGVEELLVGVSDPSEHGAGEAEAADDAVGRQADPGLGSPVHRQVGAGAEFEVRRQPHTGEPAGTQSVVQGDGHGLVRIGPEADGEIVRLSLLAVEHQGVGL